MGVDPLLDGGRVRVSTTGRDGVTVRGGVAVLVMVMIRVMVRVMVMVMLMGVRLWV